MTIHCFFDLIRTPLEDARISRTTAAPESAVVTDGAGFIGSALVDALVARGPSVAMIDDLSRGRRANLAQALAAGARLHEVDITDAASVERVIVAERPDVIFHFAAQIDVRRSHEDPAQDATVNVGGTVNLLDAGRRAGVTRFVFASTGGAIYGDTPVVPTPESVPARSVSPYGQGKHAAEGYCELYSRTTGLRCSVVRCANVYGPRQDACGEAGVVAIFAGRMLRGEAPIIHGDGRQTRDHVYVDDAVAATLAAAD